MPIGTPEVPSTGGCLDSDAFTDGAPLDAYKLRSIIRLANRLTSEEQLLFDLSWSEAANPDLGSTTFEGIGPLQWTRVLPAIPVVKRPFLNRAEVLFRCAVPLGQTLEVFVGTSRHPWRETRQPDLTITGTGAFEDYTISDLEITEAEEEWFELWVRGVPTTTLANTAIYGAPNRRSSATPIGQYTIVRGGEGVTISGSTSALWNYSGPNTLAAGGHYIRFEDANGDPIGGPRTIVGHYGATTLLFAPALNQRERILADDDANGAGGGDFSIFELARYAVAQFAAYAVARSDAPGLIAPFHAHPGTPATGKALAGALRAARLFQRTNARRIGNQQYPLFVRRPLLQLQTTWAIFDGDWVDVARFDDVRLPEIALYVTAHLSWRLANVNPARVHLRVIVTDGTNTDTGADGAPSDPIEPSADADVTRQPFTLWSPGDPAIGETVAQVLVSAARVLSGGVGSRTVRVQAFADGAGVAERLQPGLVTAWWTAR